MTNVKQEKTKIISPTNIIGKKLRIARQNHGMSLRELAKLAEISASMLSQIETGKASPSVGSLYKIAAVLDVSMDYFFPAQEKEHAATLESNSVEIKDLTASEMREAILDANADKQDIALPHTTDDHSPMVHIEARPIIDLKSGVTWSRLTAKPEKNAEFLEIAYSPGAASGRAMSRHNGREFGLVLEGELTVELGFETYTLPEGDSIIFESFTPHRLSNNTNRKMRAIWVVFTSE